jgi:hypothetical protein
LSAYQEFLDETYKVVSDRSYDLVMDTKRVLQKELEEAQQQLTDFDQKSPLAGCSGEQMKILFATLTALEDRKAAIIAARAELEGRLAWTEKAVADKSDLLAFQLKVNEWAARSGLDKLPAEARRGLDPQQAYIRVLRQELAENRAIQQGLDQAIEKEQARVQELRAFELQEERLRGRIASYRSMFEAIMKRANEMNLTRDFGGYEAKIVDPPRVKKN